MGRPGTSVEVTCYYCEESFRRAPSNSTRSKRQFCSRDCYWAQKADDMTTLKKFAKTHAIKR
jgi:hypothetical protein